MKRRRSKKNARSPPFLCTHDVCSPLRGPKPFVAKDSRALNQHEASGSTMHPCRSGQGCETCQRVPVRKRGKAAGRDQRDGATERKEQDQLGEAGERRDQTNEAAEVRQGPSDPTERRPFQCRHEKCERCFKSKRVKALSEIRTADIEATTYEDVAVGVTLRVIEAIMNKHNPDGSSREDLVAKSQSLKSM
ncbi:hypothetical protein QOT17_007150 [Balamuthia mandrillaris]